VLDQVISDRRIERPVREWELGDRRLDEAHRRVAPRCDLDHGRRDVHACRLSAPRRCPRRRVTHTSTDVEHSHTRFDTRCIEQCIDRLASDRAPEMRVAVGTSSQPAASYSSNAWTSISLISQRVVKHSREVSRPV